MAACPCGRADARGRPLAYAAGWRSALATKTLQDMGMTNVAHIDGGFAEWKKQGAPMETLEAHKQAPAARHSAQG